jgi:serine/threonine protein kinase
MNRGTKLGPYQITDQLGKGGMGEVYRATDTRLDRTVAIKVLPEHLASDPQRRERFEREAKAHPTGTSTRVRKESISGSTVAVARRGE